MFKTKRSIIWMIASLVLGLFLVIGVSFPFLSGPSHLYDFSRGLYDIVVSVSVFLLIGIPIGLVWMVVGLVRKNKVSRMPVFLVAASFFAIFNQIYVEDVFRDHARERSIQEATGIISAIESYQGLHNQYPDSLTQLVPGQLDTIAKPSSMGSMNFVYDRLEKGYELEFYQYAFVAFNIEIVRYNPTGNHRGWGGIPCNNETGHKNWKYLVID